MAGDALGHGSLLRAAMEGTPDAVLAADEHGRVCLWNPAAARLFDLDEEPEDDRCLSDLHLGPRVAAVVDDARAGEVTVGLEVPVGPPAERRVVSVTVAPLGAAVRGVGRGVSLIARVVGADATSSNTLYDDLTGLPGRTLLLDRLAQALDPRAGTELLVGLMVVDLDAFHALNVTLGSEVGDAALVKIARLIEGEIQASDTVARIGSDEFGVLVHDAHRHEGTRAINGVIDALTTSPAVTVDGGRYPLRASIGVARSAPGTPAAVLVRSAHVAIDGARARGGGAAEEFDADAHGHILARHRLEVELARAVDRGELTVHYQPLVDLERNEVVGLEALVRWRHPRRGLLSPGQFVPLAEESGEIVAVDRWVLDTACGQLAAWKRAGLVPDELEVSVNLSARQIHRPALVDDVSQTLFRHGVSPGSVVLEVTETAVMADPAAATATLEKLEDLGVGLALDDFGTGYSSLSQLRRLPLSTLKVDRTFVEGIARSGEEWALASAIVKLAHSLGQHTVAEGVEDPAQLAHLRSLRCDRAQGYLFTRPLPPDEILPWMRAREER